MPSPYYALSTGNVCAIDQATRPFPPLDYALAEPNGLLAIGGDLDSERLLDAYRQGIFPWYSHDEPVMWWSPDPRMVLFPNSLKVARSLKKVIKQNLFDIRINTAFSQVITACAKTQRPDQDGTWIMPEMMAAYTTLHELGYAHSVEAWQDDTLVGGCYGVKIGHMFYGESMFHTVSNASKVAFVHLVEWLNSQQVGMIDCQMHTPLLASFGATEIPRDDFLQKLKQLIAAETTSA